MISLNYLLADFATPITPDIKVAGLNLDSRNLKTNEVFVALAGSATHGINFAKAAIKQGASTIIYQDFKPQQAANINLTELPIKCIKIANLAQNLSKIAARFYGLPCTNLEITAITGTNGKSSIAYGLNTIINNNLGKSAVLGTLGFAGDGKITSSTHTTPDAINTQKIIQDLTKSNLGYLVMEASSHGLIQGRINAVPVNTAIFTNLSHEHLDYHQTMTKYQQAKRLLFTKSSVKTAIININDEFGQQLQQEFSQKLRIITYGLNIAHTGEFVCAENIKFTARGTNFEFISSWGKATIDIKLLGLFNVENVLAMLAGYLLMDGDFKRLAIIAANIQPLNGRMQCFGDHTQPLVVVDFAHTPDALAKSLQALRQHMQAAQQTGNLYCVFGCGGNRDREKRPLMAKIAEKYADFIIITDDNPRTEPRKQIIEQIIDGFSEYSEVTIIKDREQAIFSAIKSATHNDVVLVAGKGHETSQIIGTKTIHFSDQEQARVALC